MLSHREEAHPPGVGGAAGLVGLRSYEEIALKRRLRKRSPSEPWVEHGACLDHARHEGWGPSPSAVAIGELLLRPRGRRKSIRLAPEDATSLKAEIASSNNKSNKLTRLVSKR